jgi:serine/threonine-protein kinase
MPLSSGTRLGPYEIVDAIGAGGMGEVYRARDTRLDRLVAVKVLCETFGADARSALLREARAAAALNHPNICTIHEIGDAPSTAPGQPAMFIVMEHVDGRSMSALVGEGLEHQAVIGYAKQIADALSHAHDRGIVHRDLKCANLMVTPDGRVKVLDFGIAKATGEGATPGATAMATASGMIAGTPPYMAPEVLRGDAADRRSDIWAIGVMLYEMTAGRRPFVGDTPFALTAAILRDEPPALPRGVPPLLKSVIARCLEKDPAARFQRAAEIRSALEAEPVPRTVKLPTRRSRPRKPAEPKTDPSSASRIRSLAVLPLDNVARDPEQEYFVDGMTDELIAAVARIEGLRVISRQSIMRFKHTTKSASEIARQLGVDAIVGGSVKRSGDRVRIFVQLINPSDESYVWTTNFDNDIREIHTLESAIAGGVADEIALKIVPGTKAGVRRVDPEAYADYLRGRYFWHRATEQNIRKAIEHFQSALGRDPGFAPAHAGLALCHNGLAWYGWDAPAQAFPRARAAAAAALQLDESLADAHAALGYVAMFHDRDWALAEQELTRAVSLDPANPDVRLLHSWYLNARARHDEAIAQTRLALERDPLSAMIATNVAFMCYFAGRRDIAYDYCRQSLEVDPSFVMARWVRGLLLADEGRIEESVPEFEAARQVPIGQHIGWLGFALGRAGRSAEARGILDELERMTGARTTQWAEIAHVHLGLDEPALALDALERALDEQEPWLSYLAVDRSTAPIKDEPRFAAILQRLGLDGVRLRE